MLEKLTVNVKKMQKIWSVIASENEDEAENLVGIKKRDY